MKLEISVPNLNDSFSKVVLEGVQYQIRFTWNNYAQRWSFGLYDMQKNPIAEFIRIVPNFPLTVQVMMYNKMPFGTFGVYTDLHYVGRNDFINGKAVFAYISASGVDDNV